MRLSEERFWDVARAVERFGSNTYADHECWLMIPDEKRREFVEKIRGIVERMYDYASPEFREFVVDRMLTLDGIEEVEDDRELETIAYVIGEMISVRWIVRSKPRSIEHR